MRDLAPGQRVSLEGSAIEVRFDGPELDRLTGELGALLVALDGTRNIPADFAPINATSREMRPGASFGNNGDLHLDLAALPPQVERLLLVLFVTRGVGAGLTFRDFGSLAVTLGGYRFCLDLTDRGEAALIMIEVYRRAEAWKLTANGQGFVGGMGALASALGLDLPIPERTARPRAPCRSPHGSGDSRAGTSFSGTGFAVDRRHILTNAHVVEGARSVRVAGETATIAAEIVLADRRNDIAVLRTDQDLAAVAQFRDLFEIHLGEDVVVMGFPLHGLLGSGPSATGGNVSALCGIGNDTSILQFSAPIASGNSGGPILDEAGLVVGLVHASLNLEQVREAGNRAENINFGVKGAIVRTFLASAGIEPQIAGSGTRRSRAEIVREARAYIYRIMCEG